MSKRGLAALHQALSEPAGPHLDDETLARIADAEMAGEDVAALFKSQITHMELCEECAAAYSELVVMLQSTVEEMGQIAEALSIPEPPFLDISSIWRRAFSLTAERIGSGFRLKLVPEALQLRESSPIYDVGDDWRLPLLTLPVATPIHLNIYFTLQTALTCRLTIKLQDINRQPLPGYTIQIQYNQVIETAETTPTGAAQFNDLPILALPDLSITL